MTAAKLKQLPKLLDKDVTAALSFFFPNPVLFAIYTSSFRKLCKIVVNFLNLI
jgi:hypothetical protein